MSERVFIDGGDLACGELLMEIAAPVRALEAGTQVRIVATDPAAPLDIPAWCHLTRHRYLGAGAQPDGRPHYDVQVTATPRHTRADRPWSPE